MHLSKKKEDVQILLLTKKPGKELLLDVKKAGEQYGHFEIRIFPHSHDCFLIIDETEVYHLGASISRLYSTFTFRLMPFSPCAIITKKVPLVPSFRFS